MIGTLLRARPIEQKGAAVQAFARQVVPLLGSGAIEPVVDGVFPADQAAEAFDHLGRPGKFGKVLLSWTRDAPSGIAPGHCDHYRPQAAGPGGTPIGGRPSHCGSG